MVCTFTKTVTNFAVMDIRDTEDLLPGCSPSLIQADLVAIIDTNKLYTL